MLIAHRKPIKHVSTIAPIRHKPGHPSHESIIVSRLAKMHKLVHDDVFETFRRLLGQLRIKANAPCFGIAATPLCFHALHVEAIDANPDAWLPLCKQLRNSPFEGIAIPIGQ